jgi:hypothetical protein
MTRIKWKITKADSLWWALEATVVGVLDTEVFLGYFEKKSEAEATKKAIVSLVELVVKEISND